MKSSGFRLLLTAAVCFLLANVGAGAQPRTRALTPIPYNDNSPVSLSVSLDQTEPRIGSTVSICFEASKQGFATLWNISTAGEVARVFPNQFSSTAPDATRGVRPSTPVAAAPIQGGRRYCAGTGGDPFRFRVDGPTGTEDLYLIWTTRPDLQPSGTSYADAAALVADMQRLGGSNSSDWGTAKVTYDIVPASGPAPVAAPVPPQPPAPPQPTPSQQASNDDQVPPAPAPPPPTAPGAQDSPKVWILAMGANVPPLTKTNQDASQFTTEVMKVFNVPQDHVHLLENGKKADFIAGMDWLTSVAQPRDFVFIYFAGHGGRFKSSTSSDGWDEFLVPYDFVDENSDPKNLIFSQQFAYLINRLQTKKVIAVVESCHGAGVYRGLQADMLGARSEFYRLPPQMTDDALAAALQANLPRTRAMGGRGRIAANGLLLAASKREQSAYEGSQGALFTIALVHEMESEEGGNLMDVFNRTVQLTQQYSQNRQNPEAVGDFELGHNVNFSK